TLAEWCKRKRVELRFIQPGKPMQNGYMERLNRFYREDVLDAYWFNDLHQIRTLTDKWREDYNRKHPHSALGDIPPREYKDRFGEEFFPEPTNIKEKLLNLEMS
ncbi:transposase, partial [Arenibacter sp. S6351L]|uniref:integrase core domain-containing protein n=1 Tax=Arenibacter sp. S6351L TaxID=2926407 RepID=UPI001FF50ADD